MPLHSESARHEQQMHFFLPSFLPFFFFVFVLFFVLTGFLFVTALAVLELALVDQAGTKLCLPSSGIKGVNHHCPALSFLKEYQGSNL